MSGPKRRRQLLLILIVLLVVIFGGVATYKLWSHSEAAPKQVSATCDLEVGNECFTLEIANTGATRTQGLSGRRNLPANQAMLFVFDQPANECFWMKDMNFPIDIVWLNASKQVVHVVSDASPSSYPGNFCPDEKAQYVLEFNAGVAAELGLADGQQLQFQTN